jgi:hypothetical protein
VEGREFAGAARTEYNGGGEEEWEEEGEEWEYASYKHGTGSGHDEVHPEEGLLFQPLGESANADSLDGSNQGVRRDVAGGCPSTHDPCWKDVHGGHGKANQGGGSGCRSGRRSGGHCVTGNEGGGWKSPDQFCALMWWVPGVGYVCGVYGGVRVYTSK